MQRLKVKNIGCFIIHLQRATTRLARVECLSRELPITPSIIDAIDGSGMTRNEEKHYKRHLSRSGPSYPFTLLPTEVATFLSHRKCWQAILDADMDAALILEDDIALEPLVFAQAYEMALSCLAPGDLIRFPIKLREKPAEIILEAEGVSIIKPKKIGLGMCAQLVTRDAARKLLERTESFDRPVDTYLQMSWDHELRVLSVWPSGVSEISAEIGGSLIRQRKAFRSRLRREILRPLYRLRLSLYLKLNTPRS